MIARLLLLAAFFSLPQNARAWGDTAHFLVTHLACELADGFWSQHMGGLGGLSLVPDNEWKSPELKKQEGPLHFFDLDLYVADLDHLHEIPRDYAKLKAKHGAEFLSKNGTAPWRVAQIHAMAVEAARKDDEARVQQLAGALSHYVADLSQPLHLTKNYDGRETGNPGIHKFFEIDVIDQANQRQLRERVLAGAKKLLADPAYLRHREESPIEAALKEGGRAFAKKDELIRVDLKQGRGKKGAKAQLKLAEERLSDAVASLVLLLKKIYGPEKKSELIPKEPIPAPIWIPPLE